MLTITVSVNDTTIAKATASNISDLAEISDYHVETYERDYPPLGIPESRSGGLVRGHPRSTSVWNLVRKIALIATGDGMHKASAWDKFQNDLLAKIDDAPEIYRTLVAISVIDFYGENPLEKPPDHIKLSWSSVGLKIDGGGALADKIQRDVYGDGSNEEE